MYDDRRMERNHTARLCIEDIAGQAAITVEDAARLLGIGRSAAYEAARRNQLPVIRIGRRLLVPVPRLMAMLANEPLAADTALVAL